MTFQFACDNIRVIRQSVLLTSILSPKIFVLSLLCFLPSYGRCYFCIAEEMPESVIQRTQQAAWHQARNVAHASWLYPFKVGSRLHDSRETILTNLSLGNILFRDASFSVATPPKSYTPLFLPLRICPHNAIHLDLSSAMGFS